MIYITPRTHTLFTRCLSFLAASARFAVFYLWRSSEPWSDDEDEPSPETESPCSSPAPDANLLAPLGLAWERLRFLRELVAGLP